MEEKNLSPEAIQELRDQGYDEEAIKKIEKGLEQAKKGNLKDENEE